MSTRRAWPWLLTAVLAVATMTVAGCSGVPESSPPQVVRELPVGTAGGGEPSIAPPNGIDPRNLVDDFLEANAADATEHSSARAYLSPQARNTWSDTTVTVVSSTSTGLYDPAKPYILVRGKVLGTVDANGVYTPALNEASRLFVYGVALVHGQYRISSLRDGLLLTQDQFLDAYTQHNVYFFDLAHRYLVPDPRWSSLTDPTQLSDWLMGQLADGPSASVAGAVSADTLPAQAAAHRISVSVGGVTKIEIPGASQLGSQGRERLATQVGNTLSEADRGRTLEITDNGKPVKIPTLDQAQFDPLTFQGALGPSAPAPQVYFVRAGQMIDGSDDDPVRGAVNNGTFALSSVAVTGTPGSLTVAGTAAVSGVDTLVVGTQSGGLRATAVKGTLTRPAFVPGNGASGGEAWVGDGGRLYAVTIGSGAPRVTSVGLPSTVTGARIVALRLSPEGSRIAMILSSSSGRQLWVGVVVRTAGQLRVDTLQQVSPEGVTVTDLAWVEASKLVALGYSSTGEAHIYDVGSDGSDLTARDIGNLPNAPTSLTVTIGQPAWVTANGSVWQQDRGDLWISPGPGDQTTGTNPVYLQ